MNDNIEYTFKTWRSLLLYGWLMGFVVDFHHTNIALPEQLDWWLRVVLVMPGMHKVHHSRIQIETDSKQADAIRRENMAWKQILGRTVNCSWMNQIEIWFGILTGKILKHGTFKSTYERAFQI